MRRRLGRKGIKLRNRIVFVIALLALIFFINFILGYQEKIEKEKYAKQAESLIKARESIIDNLEGTTYYISAEGISEDGTDINSPMSLDTASKKKYYSNDRILFKAGDVFYGILKFDVEVIEDKYIYIGSYGEGEKPIISGANILVNSQAWVLEEKLYKLDLSDYSNFEGIGQNANDLYNIGFFSDEEGNIYGNRKKTKEELEEEYDYYCEDKYLYVKCSENPSKKLGKIKLVAGNNLVYLESNTIMENIDVQYTGVHGIVNKDGNHIRNVYIKNCIIQNIGGSVQNLDTFTRYGNGIQFWNSAANTIVEGCIFRNIYDAAYTMQGNTTLDGFENNICRNNIFIKCTYSYETFARNKNDSTIKLFLKEQQFTNNISINQGDGWGYKARPDKNYVAEFAVWAMPIDDTDINISNNTYYNSRMLYYKGISYGLTVQDFKKCVISDNNTFYLNSNTMLIDMKGNYEDFSIFEEYGINANSKFNLLSNYEIEKISKKDILNSNNYDEIKTYYENLEEEFKYMEIEELLLEQYNELTGMYETQINTNTKMKQQIEQLKVTIENIIKGDSIIDTERTIELLSENYDLANTIIDEDIQNYEYIIKKINEIGNYYSDLLALNTTENSYDVSGIEKQLNEMLTKLEQNKDLKVEIVDYLVETSKEYYNTYITTSKGAAGEVTCKIKQVEELLNLADKILSIKIEEYINNVVVTIEYSSTKLTNQDVTATIKANYDIQITNNNNSPTYTFTQNDSFTFQYTVRNKPYTVTAMVTNIDKTPPTITGVEEGQLYYIEQEIVPQITDTNLKEVILYINGVQIDYKKGQPLIVEGLYKIVATDEAGNTKTLQFQVMEKPDEKYIMQENSIQNIKYNTTKTKFDAKVKIQETYTIERKTDNETIQLKSTDTIASGDILTTTSGKKYTLIVSGDLTKDGVVDIQDFVRMRRYLLGLRELDEVETLAADANVDSKDLSISDYIRIRILILNQLAGI